jgi:hypothetical protein
VQKLLMIRGFPVDVATSKIIFGRIVNETAAAALCARTFASRFACEPPVTA